MNLCALIWMEPVEGARWLTVVEGRRLAWCVGIVVLGAGLYGAVMGAWREPWQAVYTGLKLPLLLLLTTVGNALLNAMLAPLLGLNLSLRQSFAAVLLTFAIASVVLGSLAPIAAFVVWNSPPLTVATPPTALEYGMLQLVHAGMVAVSGTLGNLAFLPMLRGLSGSGVIAWRVLLAWLGVNLLLGSQLCWILRPFIWDPARPVEFVGPEYLRGSFYETVFEAARRLIQSNL